MRKILNLIVLIAFFSQQVAWAVHLPWRPDFESSSVLPYHIDGDGKAWVLLSKKTYPEKEYDAPAWGDFGGKVEDGERAVKAAVRELAEETAGQITTSEEELLAGPIHQMDMRNSPFGEGIRRHTIFFKIMKEMLMPKVEDGVDRGPSSDGSREVSQYQWVLAKNLLGLAAPARFGEVLGLYTPDALRVDGIGSPEKRELFSVPFFVLLQQTGVKNILMDPARFYGSSLGSSSSAAASAIVYPKSFSQIVFSNVLYNFIS